MIWKWFCHTEYEIKTMFNITVLNYPTSRQFQIQREKKEKKISDYKLSVILYMYSQLIVSD